MKISYDKKLKIFMTRYPRILIHPFCKFYFWWIPVSFPWLFFMVTSRLGRRMWSVCLILCQRMKDPCHSQMVPLASLNLNDSQFAETMSPVTSWASRRATKNLVTFFIHWHIFPFSFKTGKLKHKQATKYNQGTLFSNLFISMEIITHYI